MIRKAPNSHITVLVKLPAPAEIRESINFRNTIGIKPDLALIPIRRDLEGVGPEIKKKTK